MKSRPSILRNERVSAYLQIVLGCAIGALAFPMFLAQYDIAPGGLTGIATILHYLLLAAHRPDVASAERSAVH